MRLLLVSAVALAGTLTVPGPGDAAIVETTPATGLSGLSTARPGSEVPLYTVGLLGDNTTTLQSLSVTLSDLSTPTGTDADAITQLRLYRSSNSAFDGSDVQVGVQSTVSLGAPTTIALTTPAVWGFSERYYIVTAALNTDHVDEPGAAKDAFRVAAPAGSVSTSTGSIGSPVPASDAARITIDVTATRVVFTTTPADPGVFDPADEVVSGQPFATQPVVQAQDDYGNVDVDFQSPISLSRQSGNGVLSGQNTRAAVAGVADFAGSSLAFTSAGSDGQVFILKASAAGLTQAFVPLSADAVATELVFAASPAPGGAPHGDVVSRQPFATQPVVAARDLNGVVDDDFDDQVTIALSQGNGVLLGTTRVQAVAGTATFTDLAYGAAADQEGFRLGADDQATGSGGDLSAGADSAPLVADVVATRIAFANPPAHPGTPHGDVVSGQPFAAQPALEAQDAGGARDIHYGSGNASLSVASGRVVLSGGLAVPWAAGRANFAGTGLTAVAAADQEPFALRASDGVLTLATTPALVADVVATRIAFAPLPTHPGTPHGDVVSGQPFATQPALEAQDSNGVRDVHFAGATASLSVASGNAVLTGVATANWSAGQASFTGLAAVAASDTAIFALAAASAGLASATTPALVADVVATRLVFATVPADSAALHGSVVDGRPFAVQPVLEARDAGGSRDLQLDSGTVTISVASGAVTLQGSTSRPWTDGRAEYSGAGLRVAGSQDGQTFVLAASSPGLGQALTPTLVDDVVATRLVFAAVPAHAGTPHGSVINGRAFATQPAVQAQDAGGRVDMQFADQVTLTGTPGQLRGTTSAAASNATAQFAGLAYLASQDQESFQLRADDQAGGPEGDLPAVVDSSRVADVVATRIAFGVPPADPAALHGSVVNGRPFATQPVLEAQDSTGVRDLHYAQGSVGLSVGSGNVVLQGTATSRPWVNGRADFAGSQLRAAATTDNALFALAASSPGLIPGTTPELSVDALATRMAFAAAPADPAALRGNVVNGKPFATQPVLEAQDSTGVRDAHFAQGSVTLSVASGSVSLQGTAAVRPWVDGRVDYAGAGLKVLAAQDGQSFVLSAQTGAFPTISTPTLVDDAVAAAIAFVVPPADPAAVRGNVANGRPFATQPVLEARDSTGVHDVHYAQGSVQLSVPYGMVLQGTAARPWVEGRVDFAGSGLKVQGIQDAQSFALTAAASGLGQAAVALTSDVVASRLRFVAQPAHAGVPAGTVVQDQPFTTQPVLEAQDSTGLRDIHFTAGAAALSVAWGNALLRGNVRQEWLFGQADFAGHGLALDARTDDEKVVLRATAENFGPVSSDTLRVDLQATRLAFLQGPRRVGSRGAELAAPQVRVAAVYADSTVDPGFAGPVTLRAVLPGTNTPAADSLVVLPGPVLALAQGQAAFSSVVYTGVGTFQLLATSPGLQPAHSDTVTLSGSLLLAPPDRQVPDQLAHQRGTRPEQIPLLALELRPDGESLVLQDLRVQLELRGGLAAEHLGAVHLWRDQGTTGRLDAADQRLASTAALDSLAVFARVEDLLEDPRDYLVTWAPAVPLREGWRIRARVTAAHVRGRSPGAPGLAAVPVTGPVVEGNLHAVGVLGLPHHLRLGATPDSLPADSLSRSTLVAEVLDAWEQPLGYDTSSVVTFATLSGGAVIDGPLTAAARQGQATTLLLAGTTPGTVRIRAGSPGLGADTAEVVLRAGRPARLVLRAVPATLVLGSVEQTRIRVLLLDARGYQVTGNPSQAELRVTDPGYFPGSGQPRVLRIDLGQGSAEVALLAGQPGMATVRATIGDLADSLEIPVVSTRMARLVLTADTSAIPADGSRLAHVTAALHDGEDQLVGGDDTTAVAFAVVQGQAALSQTSATLRGGQTSVQLQALGTAGALRIRATAPGVEAGELELAARAAAARRVDLMVLPSQIAADGRATALLSAVVRDTLNNLVADTSLEVSFAVSAGHAEIVGPLTAPTVRGIARTTLRASVRAGQVGVQAQAGDLRPGQATLVLLPGQPAKLLLQASRPALPAESGATCELVALVQDVFGNTAARDSTTLVSFSVSGGPAAIAGPAVALARGGVARAVLRSTGVPGEALVYAGAPGLIPSTLAVPVRRDQAPRFATSTSRLQMAEDGPPLRLKLAPLVADEDDGLEELVFRLEPPDGPVRGEATLGVLLLSSAPDYSGTRTLELVVRDPGGLETRTRLIVEVAPVNDPPRIVSVPDTLAWVDSLYVCQVQATDPDGDALAYRLATAPASMGFDRALKRAVWRPRQAGTYPVSFVVSDGRDSVRLSFQVRVQARPNDLRFTSQPPLSVRRGQLYTYQPRLANPGGSAPAFVLVRAPTQMRVDARSGLLTWVPGDTGADSAEVILKASVGAQEVRQQFNIRVVSANRPPQFRSQPDTTAWVDSLYLYAARADDADGDPIVFQLIAGPSAVRIDPGTGMCAWVPAPADLGTVRVEVGASDGQHTTVQRYNLHVRRPDQPEPPRPEPPRGFAIDPAAGTGSLALDPLVNDAAYPDSLLQWQAERITGDPVTIAYASATRTLRFAVQPGFTQAQVLLRVHNPAGLSAQFLLALARLQPGDLDRNTAIELGDFFRIVDSFDATPGSANWRAEADLDQNGRVDLQDYRRFVELFARPR